MDCGAQRRAAHHGRVRLQSSCVLFTAVTAERDARRAESQRTSCSSHVRARPPRPPPSPTRRRSLPLPTLRTRCVSFPRPHGKVLCSDVRRATRLLASGRGWQMPWHPPATRRPAGSSSLARARSRAGEPFAKRGHAPYRDGLVHRSYANIRDRVTAVVASSLK